MRIKKIENKINLEDNVVAENSYKCHQELICKGWFLPSNTYDCGSFVVN